MDALSGYPYTDTTSTYESETLMTVFLGLAIAVGAGALLALQASVNPRLGRAVGSPLGGATVQLWAAFGLLTAAAALTGAFAALPSLGEADGWQLLGGIASPLYITTGILLVPRLGALATGGVFVAGQVLGSVALDSFGLLGLDRRPFSLGIVLGPALVLAGVLLALRSQGLGGGASARPAVGRIAWVALGLVAGAALPVQGAVNARLGGHLHQPVLVAWISFLVAATTITIVLLAVSAVRRAAPLSLRDLRSTPWWAWLGAPAAVVYVTATFLLIPQLGAATTVLLTVTGQQVAGAFIDARGAFGLPRRPFTTRRLIALALLIAGSALVELL